MGSDVLSNMVKVEIGQSWRDIDMNKGPFTVVSLEMTGMKRISWMATFAEGGHMFLTNEWQPYYLYAWELVSSPLTPTE